MPAALSDLLARLKLLKAGGVEATFGEKLDKVEETLPPAPQVITVAPIEMKMVPGKFEVTVDEPKSPDEDWSKFLPSYEISEALPPAYIISQAWLRILDEIDLLLQSQV